MCVCVCVCVCDFNTYIKIHPFVIIKYFKDVTNLVIIASNGTYQPINNNNPTTLGPLLVLVALANTRWCRTNHCTTKT